MVKWVLLRVKNILPRQYTSLETFSTSYPGIYLLYKLNFSSQVSEEGGCEAIKVADLFSDVDDLPQSQAAQQVSSPSQTESSVDMFEDSEDNSDRVADLFSSNDPSQQVQTGSDFESEPELESVLSSL